MTATYYKAFELTADEMAGIINEGVIHKSWNGFNLKIAMVNDGLIAIGQDNEKSSIRAKGVSIPDLGVHVIEQWQAIADEYSARLA